MGFGEITVKRLFAIGLVVAGALCAQEKITMPFSNPSAPHKLNVDLMLGSVTVKGYEGRDVIVEYTAGSNPVFPTRRGTPEPPPSGRKRRLDLTETATTAGPTLSTTEVTACEYASRASSSGMTA